VQPKVGKCHVHNLHLVTVTVTVLAFDSPYKTMSTPTQLIIFDFDWSMVDQDTDRWVLEVLSTKLRRKLQTIKAGGSQCTPDVV
jgi:hypothetical protein